MTLTIRRARPGDLDRVVDLLGQATTWLASRGLDQWQDAEPELRRDRVSAGITAGQVWIVERDGRAVATITIDTTADPELWHDSTDQGDALYVHRMIVTRDEAGHQLGAALLDFAAQQATAAGRTWLRLDAWATNTKLHDYYRSQGFTHLRTTYYAHRGSGALFQRPAHTQTHRGPTLTHATDQQGAAYPHQPDQQPRTTRSI
jgi:GNAT superfamily N-acetyltransferase